MKCETIRNMISSYIDKDLNDIEKAELEKHLAECQQCREEYESMLDIIAVCSNLEELDLPQSFRTELHQRLVVEKKKRNFFSGVWGNRGMKMATGVVAAALIVVIGIGSSGLLSGKNANTAQNAGAAPDYGVATAPAAPYADYDTTYSMKKSAEGDAAPAAEAPEMALMDKSFDETAVGLGNEAAIAGQAAPAESITASRSGRMVIRTGNISVNVENVDKAASEIRQLTEGSGGYIENSQIDNITVPQVEYTDGVATTKETTEKQANITIRVPEAQFQAIFNNIKGMGKLQSENVSGTDITSEYRDTQARVDNLKIQEQSLQQLMTKGQTVDEILKIETELNRVRTDIDLYTGTLKQWDNMVQLSTINIYMRELTPEELKSVDVPGMWDKAYQGLIKAINNVVGGFEKAVIVLVASIPYLAILGVFAVIGLFTARKIKSKKKQ
ncbi:MAG TPA: DUF4349 domain-containing protein [Negativicutes bacterium]|nr:DUF4349 domain-containing protein [Negativicutes bacterium]